MSAPQHPAVGSVLHIIENTTRMHLSVEVEVPGASENIRTPIVGWAIVVIDKTKDGEVLTEIQPVFALHGQACTSHDVGAENVVIYSTLDPEA